MQILYKSIYTVGPILEKKEQIKQPNNTRTYAYTLYARIIHAREHTQKKNTEKIKQNKYVHSKHQWRPVANNTDEAFTNIFTAGQIFLTLR